MYVHLKGMPIFLRIPFVLSRGKPDCTAAENHRRLGQDTFGRSWIIASNSVKVVGQSLDLLPSITFFFSSFRTLSRFLVDSLTIYGDYGGTTRTYLLCYQGYRISAWGRSFHHGTILQNDVRYGVDCTGKPMDTYTIRYGHLPQPSLPLWWVLFVIPLVSRMSIDWCGCSAGLTWTHAFV